MSECTPCGMSSMGVSLVSGDEEHRRRSTQQLGLVSFVSEEEAEGYRRRRSTHAGLRELCVGGGGVLCVGGGGVHLLGFIPRQTISV